MNALHTSIEDRLRGFIGSPAWPQKFALEHQALCLNLTDLQVEIALHVHRKGDDGCGVAAATRMVDEWVAVKQSCENIIKRFGDAVFEHVEQRLVWLDLASDVWPAVTTTQRLARGRSEVRHCLSNLPGGFDAEETRKRLGWCKWEELCNHPNHWGHMSGNERANAMNIWEPSIHPAWVADAFNRLWT